MSLKESLSENIKTKEAELKRMSETLATLSNELHDVGSPHAALRTQQRAAKKGFRPNLEADCQGSNR